MGLHESLLYEVALQGKWPSKPVTINDRFYCTNIKSKTIVWLHVHRMDVLQITDYKYCTFQILAIISVHFPLSVRFHKRSRKRGRF